MAHKFLKTTKDFKGKVALEELRRAHVVIVLLSLSMTFLLVVSADVLNVNGWLVTVASVLLLATASISASVALVISRK